MPQTMRAFIAINLPEQIKSDLDGIANRLKTVGPPARWVPAANLHITLKFLDEIGEDQVTPLLGAIRMAIDTVSPFNITLAGFGVFPNPERARVFWIGITDGVETLRPLTKAIDEQVHGLGFAPEKRAFSAHLTLARLRQPGPADSLLTASAESPIRPTSIRVDHIDLMRSILSPRGAEYSVLGSVAPRET